MSTEQELNELLTAVREWSFQDLMAAEAMLTAESKHAEADDVAYSIGRKAQADEAWLALIARIRALLAELDAAREDAARYQWLAVQHWVEQEATFRLGLKNVDFINTYLEELGVAIDAARKGEA